MAAELQGRARPGSNGLLAAHNCCRSSRSACGTRVAEDSNRANRTAAVCASLGTSAGY
jgi:hypothetical protein